MRKQYHDPVIKETTAWLYIEIFIRMKSEHIFLKIERKNENQRMHVHTFFSYPHKDASCQFLASDSQFGFFRFSKNFSMMAGSLTPVD